MWNLIFSLNLIAVPLQVPMSYIWIIVDWMAFKIYSITSKLRLYSLRAALTDSALFGDRSISLNPGLLSASSSRPSARFFTRRKSVGEDISTLKIFTALFRLGKFSNEDKFTYELIKFNNILKLNFSILSKFSLSDVFYFILKWIWWTKKLWM